MASYRFSSPWVQILHVRLWWRLTFPSLWRAFPKSSFGTVVRMLCGKDGKRDGDTEWRIYYLEWHLTGFPHHGGRPFTFASDDALPSFVILNGGKNAVWKSRETGWWHGVKNLLHGRHLTAFPTTVTDPSHSFRMTINVFSHYKPGCTVCLTSF